jgi:hypothetical protein
VGDSRQPGDASEASLREPVWPRQGEVRVGSDGLQRLCPPVAVARDVVAGVVPAALVTQQVEAQRELLACVGGGVG